MLDFKKAEIFDFLVEELSELDPRLLSVAADYSFVGNCSTARLVMHSNHIASRPSLIRPEKKQSVISGIEYELGKYIDDVKAEYNCVVRGTVPKVVNNPELNPETSLFVEFERDGEIFLDLIDIPNHRSKHTYFGYDLIPTEELQNIRYGSPLAEGTILAKTRSLANDHSYMYGVNANVAMMADKAGAEDGYIVSESFLKKIEFTTISKRVIHLDRDTIPINLYGDDEVFKMFPDIGETVNAAGILFATRERDDYFSIVDINNEGISEIDYNFDDPVHVPKGSKVIDIKVYKGTNPKKVFSDNISEQLEKYYQLQYAYYDSIVKNYYTLLREAKQMYGSNFRPRLTPRMHDLVTEAMIFLAARDSKRKLKKDKKDIEQYRVEITCMSVVRPHNAFKLSDCAAAKGVICEVRPDDQMPFDDFGNRVDVIAGASAETISRMNIGRTYESYLGAFARDNRQRLIDMLINEKGKYYLENLNQNDYNNIRIFLRNIYSLVNPDMVEFIDTRTDEGLEEHVHEVLEDWMYLFYPPNNKYRILNVIRAIEKSPFRPNYGKLNIPVEDGRVLRTKKNIRVGRMYYMLLDRTGRDFSAVSSAKVNNYMLPTKGGEFEKYKYPHNLTPVTNLSETEMRFLMSFCSPVMQAEMVDLPLNPTSHKQLVGHILSSPLMVDPNFEIDRTLNPYGGSKPVEMLKHIMLASGVRFKYIQEDNVNRLEECNE